MNSQTKKIVFDVSYATFLKVIVIALALVVLYLVREVILWMFLAIVIASAFDPIVDFLQKRRIPRGISVVLIYVVVVGVAVTVFSFLVPQFVSQLQQLGNVLPVYLEDLSGYFEERSGITISQVLNEASKYISSFTDRLDDAVISLYSAAYSVFGGIFAFIMVFVLSFYFLIEENGFKKFIRSFVPRKQKKYVLGLVDRIQNQMGRWIRGQLFLGLVVGIITYIVLSILGVRYALVLAIIAGILEIIPYVGPVIAGILAVLIALLQSSLLALIVFFAYIVIQQLENHLLVPKIMEKAVGLNPLVIILVILAGAKIAGVSGAIVAVPAATALAVFLGDIFQDRREDDDEDKKGKDKDKKKKSFWESFNKKIVLSNK